MNNNFKKIVFLVSIVTVIICGVCFCKIGKIENLEGYMYSYAGIPNTSTSTNATSSNATGSNAMRYSTGSNSTSSNTRRNSTSSNSTSSNVRVTNNSKVEKSVSSNAKTIEVKEKVEGDLEYSNSKINDEVIDNIKNSLDNQNIIINLDEDTVIKKEVFDAIKGKNKQLTINSNQNQMIINGKDIDNSKNTNVKIKYSLIKNDNELSQINTKGIVINFADNGDLPAIAIIRLKVNDEIKNELSMDDFYLYYYDKENNELQNISSGATYNKNGYIEFAINHTSKYVLVNEKIEETEDDVDDIAVMTTGTEENVSFLESNKVYIIIIVLSILVIVVVTVIVIIDRKKKGIK